MSETIDICIIGSGVAGLSAALSLQQCGFRVAVFERDLDFIDRKQGYGLTLTYSNNGPLSKLGVLDECIRNNCPSHCHYVFSPAGDVLGYYGRELKGDKVSDTLPSEQGGNKGNLRIPRQDLRMMLIQKLQPGTIRWGWTISYYTEVTEGVTVTMSRTHHSCSSSENTINSSETMTVDAYVLVGADGIRSEVRRLRDCTHFPNKLRQQAVVTTAQTQQTAGAAVVEVESICLVQYLGVAVIIGLSSASHPLVSNRGYYVVDGQHRLFTMPYAIPQETEAGAENAQPGLTMWQLSFSGLSEEQASALRRATPAEILAEAQRRTSGWLAPTRELIAQTLTGELWATGLYDRDAMPLFNKDGRGAGGSRVTVIGDAAHPMSMFKGQGANQALADGPLLAHWLSGAAASGATGGKRRRSNRAETQPMGDSSSTTAVDYSNTSSSGKCEGAGSALASQQTAFTRLRCFERDMTARAAPKAAASRVAAGHLHSPAVLGDVFGIAGVKATSCAEYQTVLDALKTAGVGASLGADLDTAMRAALEAYTDTHSH